MRARRRTNEEQRGAKMGRERAASEEDDYFGEVHTHTLIATVNEQCCDLLGMIHRKQINCT